MKTRLLLLTILLFLSTILKANNGDAKKIKPLTTTAISDPNFEQALIDLGYDNVIDGQVLTANISGLTSLDVSDPLNNGNLPNVTVKITDLTGIEDFLALETLKVGLNSISTINLSANVLLKELWVNSNTLSSIDITSNVQLEIVYINGNQISNIDLSQNLALIEFYGTANLLTTIDVSNNVNLIKLQCAENQIKILDVSNNLSLTHLNTHLNLIENIDVSLNTSLKLLQCNNNNLKTLNIANGNNSNMGLWAHANPVLTCIQADSNAGPPAGNTQIDSQTSFNTDCSSVWTINTNTTTTAALLAITPSIDTDGSGGITLAEAAAYTGILDLSGSGITDVEGLQAFISITTLDVSGNGITDISPLTGLTATIIQRSFGQSQMVSTNTMALEELIVSNNNLEGANLDGLINLKIVDLNNNPDLITVSIQNGNNANITSFKSTNSPKLTCILVDDVNANYLTTWNIDATSVFVTDEEDCRTRVLSINEESLSTSITFYPNPVKDFLTIKLSNQLELKEIEIINLIGKKVMISKEEKVNLYNLPIGVYILKIVTNKGIVTRKIIKE